MARPSPIIDTTGDTNEFTSTTVVSSRSRPHAPSMVSPPTISGSAAATTPPNRKNSSSATAGMANSSTRRWSWAMVSFSAPATGCPPAISMSTPGRRSASATSRKWRIWVVASVPLTATEAKAWRRSGVPKTSGMASPVSVGQYAPLIRSISSGNRTGRLFKCDTIFAANAASSTVVPSGAWNSRITSPL